MRSILIIVAASVLVVSAAASATAQVRGSANSQRAASPATNPYGLSDCSQRPFARDCDRRGTW